METNGGLACNKSDTHWVEVVSAQSGRVQATYFYMDLMTANEEGGVREGDRWDELTNNVRSGV